MHKLSEKQFVWVCVRGRATAQAWKVGKDAETPRIPPKVQGLSFRGVFPDPGL